jgi:hypothetical protein
MQYFSHLQYGVTKYVIEAHKGHIWKHKLEKQKSFKKIVLFKNLLYFCNRKNKE